MDSQAKQQIAERLKTANNILVTVSSNPSVDQLASAIGFTLLLNKFGKHATAVFSGKVPSTIEFLQPELTLEKNTDSLQDFIIALDKSKADKLRYKVEDKVVKIFITPYRTSLSEKDLDFSQGDFNIDAVVAIGVHEQKELDEAITAHGRIFHDATVMSVTTHEKGTLGTINWNEPAASSLSELMVSLGEELAPNLFDAQTATAFLTGIVAETSRFSNDKTSPRTMTIAAHLMSAGANQQLIATKLEKPAPPPPPPPMPPTPPAMPQTPVTPPQPKEPPAAPSLSEPTKPVDDGALKIEHERNITPPPMPKFNLNAGSPPPPAFAEEQTSHDEIVIDPQGTLHRLDEERKNLAKQEKDAANDKKTAEANDEETPSRLVLEPPTFGNKLTANSEPEALDPSTDPLSAQLPSAPILNRAKPETSDNDQTLTALEESVHSPHAEMGDTKVARSAVSDALNSGPPTPEPIKALNAHPIELNNQAAPMPPGVTPPFGMPPNLVPPTPVAGDTTSSSGPATPPPPVPPPMMPPAFGKPPDDLDDVPPSQPLAPL